MAKLNWDLPQAVAAIVTRLPNAVGLPLASTAVIAANLKESLPPRSSNRKPTSSKRASGAKRPLLAIKSTRSMLLRLSPPEFAKILSAPRLMTSLKSASSIVLTLEGLKLRSLAFWLSLSYQKTSFSKTVPSVVLPSLTLALSIRLNLI